MGSSDSFFKGINIGLWEVASSEGHADTNQCWAGMWSLNQLIRFMCCAACYEPQRCLWQLRATRRAARAPACCARWRAPVLAPGKETCAGSAWPSA